MDISGNKFGRLTAISFVGQDIRQQSLWLVRCDCGREFVTRLGSLRSGHTKACGRHNPGQMRHGRHKTVEYAAWQKMRHRCSCKNNPSYRDYGGRGISVCERWNKFENFLADVGLRPGAGYSLDRINVNGNYEPSNVRWATKKVQSLNRRNARFVEYGGKKFRFFELASEFGIPERNLRTRIQNGMEIVRALRQPVKKIRHSHATN